MTDQQPTNEQKRWLWEQCGWKFKPTERSFRTIDWPDYVWHTPDGEIRPDTGLPPIDLNNLFEYAAPVLLEEIGKYELVVLVNKAICDAIDANLYGQEGIPNHIFWAFHNAFGGK